ncbi:capsid protein VP1 [Betapolyomavirus secumuris]|uniref:Major capsid protein VP1 n=1 Tax=Murine polyomavirus (strain Kilham) TaxID=10638 RepID=VP1_POVMK|nr:capsid protein VP1 [Betapolyomavirus secumuris]P24595.3 RecName: Full=Major capsid protein VP1; AltName: Full=Major structural protein VP1 [Kilham polyomavirus]AAA46553.1 capsid protein VP1 [Betapolyomavirus secumuris]
MAPTVKKRTSQNQGLSPQKSQNSVVVGGIQVLDVRTGPDSITQIEAFLNPRMGKPVDSDFYGFSDNITVSADYTQDMPRIKELPCYSMAKISLPMLNEDMTCDTILMWEAISCKTEVVGVSSLTNCHSAVKRLYDNEGAGFPVQGLNFHFFSVGGEALDLQWLWKNYRCNYPAGVAALQAAPKAAQVLDPKLKAKLTADGKFPIEAWSPDPAKNENTRYFGTYTGGLQTPPVLQITNTTTTILLNENGVGPLCKGDGLYLASADIVGFRTQQNNKMHLRGLPRYFSIHLRKGCANPYPVSSLLNTFSSEMMPLNSWMLQVEEVRIYDGVERLPGDPDMIRYRIIWPGRLLSLIFPAMRHKHLYFFVMQAFIVL